MNGGHWTLYDALSFGCRTVRGEIPMTMATTYDDSAGAGAGAGGEGELALLEFVFEAFLTLPDFAEEAKDVVEGEGDDNVDVDDDDRREGADGGASPSPATHAPSPSRRNRDRDRDRDDDGAAALSRNQIGRMISMLLDHASFRIGADSPTVLPASDSTSASGQQRSDDDVNGGSAVDDEPFERDVRTTESDDYDDDYSLGTTTPDADKDDNRPYPLPVPCGSGTGSATGNSSLPSVQGRVVNVTAASLLGMLPLNLDESATTDYRGGVSLDLLIDYVLDESVSVSASAITAKAVSSRGNAETTNDSDPRRRQGQRPTALSFRGFLSWYYSHENDATNLLPSQRRVGPYLLDLRLLGAIVFGVQPSDPSLERTLVEEVRRRHKYRYPQTETSRRGPPGAVWYVINVHWWRQWLDHTSSSVSSAAVSSPSPSPSASDGREERSGGRPPLGRIDNDILLSDGGSLALRSGLRWRHDFELIPPLAWSALQAWHDGGPPIHRTVVPYPAPDTPLGGSHPSPVRNNRRANPGQRSLGLSSSIGTAVGARPRSMSSSSSSSLPPPQNEIELYPLFVTVMLCDAASRGEPRPFQQCVPLSSFGPVRVLLEELCARLDVEPGAARVWMTGSSAASLAATSSAGGGRGNLPRPENGNRTPLVSDPPHDWILYPDIGLTEQLRQRGISIDPPGGGGRGSGGGGANFRSPSNVADAASVGSRSRHGGGGGATMVGHGQERDGGGGGGSKLVLMLEVKDQKDGTWPRAVRRNLERSSSNGGARGGARKGEQVTGSGIVGLYNMG